MSGMEAKEMKRALGTREWQYCCNLETRKQIAKLFAKGWTYKELAEHFSISKSTAERYCKGESRSKECNK